MTQLSLAADVAETATSQRWDRTAPTLSVLVSTFRRPQYLTGLFDTLEEQDLDVDRFEVIVVDNASQDATWDMLRERAKASRLAVCVARVDHNGGPATGRNAALGLARAERVVFTDDDCLPEPQWVRAMAEAFDGGARIVQGRTEPESGVAQAVWDHTIAIRRVTDLFETCNLGYYRDDVVAAGGFKPLRGYRPGRGGAPFGGEDTVVGWAVVKQTGAAVVFAEKAVVHHRIEPRDYRGWLKVRHGMGIFPALIANVPELRRLMFLRWFFSPRSASFDLAVLSVVVAVALRSFVPLCGIVPYLVHLAPRRRGLRSWASRLAYYVLGDAASAWSLLRGSIRQRRVVL